MMHGQKRYEFVSVKICKNEQEMREINDRIRSGAKLVPKQTKIKKSNDKWMITLKLELEWT